MFKRCKERCERNKQWLSGVCAKWNVCSFLVLLILDIKKCFKQTKKIYIYDWIFFFFSFSFRSMKSKMSNKKKLKKKNWWVFEKKVNRKIKMAKEFQKENFSLLFLFIFLLKIFRCFFIYLLKFYFPRNKSNFLK